MKIYPETPLGYPARPERLTRHPDELERKVTAALRALRQNGKPVILIVTPEGEIQIFRGERAGLIPAPPAAPAIE